MSDSVVDLFRPPFWLIVAAGLLLLVPLRAPRLRQWVLALLNLGFLAVLLHAAIAFVLVGAVLVYLATQMLGQQRLGGLVLRLALGATLILFLVHKLPYAAAQEGIEGVNPILATVGFSYVALRLVDLLATVRERPELAPGLPAVINYLLPFHMLAAGPIQAYEDFVGQAPVPAPLNVRDSLLAVERIVLGLFKKYVVAMTIQRLFLTGFRAPGPYLLWEVQFNCLWLYLDFSAYSDVAVGVGLLLGVATPENFNRPFRSRNIIEFWERWHISLSQMIRRRLFIPIQLALVRRTEGRAPLLCASVAFAISFLLCGLWHSISWPWLAWGASQAVGLIVCNLYRHFLTKRLGRKGVSAYLANRWLRWAAVGLNFEYFAFSLVLVSFPFQEYFV
jgi:D-alanyl-lipoteichoic acid acyltransferase DltB (MBOAT superfamily)